MKSLLIVIIVLIGSLVPSHTLATEATEAEKPINILIMLSYNPVLPWSQKYIEGISNAVAIEKRKVNVFVESLYLEADIQSNVPHFIRTLEIKYQNVHIDALVSDSLYSQDLFKGLYETEQFKDVYKFSFNNLKNQTSVDPKLVDLYDYSLQTITKQTNYILSTFPNTKQIYINNSINNFNRPRLVQLQNLQQNEQYEFSIHFLDFTSIADAISRVSALPEDSIFIYLPQFGPNSNQNMTPKSFLQAIAPHSTAPIFSSWLTFMGDGIVGGYILDPIAQGTTVIKAVMEKLTSGTVNPNYPFASWMIDQQLANKYDIPIPDNISPEHIFNRNTNIVIDYPIETGVLVAFVAFLGILLFWYRQIKLADAMRIIEQANIKAEQSAASATRSSEAKSKFLANISHEIRTPINGMFGVLNILSKTPLNTEQLNLMQMGRFCTDTLLRTVNDVLDFSKLESSQLQLKQIGFSPVQVLKESYGYALLISDDKPITIHLEIDKLIDVPLLGDQTRIRQIFDNLINNAVKFTDHGDITLGATITPDNSHYVMTCWINDTGEGISQQDLTRLFQPFVQIEDSYSKARSGTGLGLALCKELVELMDGSISMESQLGIGTKVTFTVHLSLADDIAVDKPEELLVDLEAVQRANILFVEDNPINQEITIVQLQHYGITMTVMNNGKECIDHLLCTDTHYDIILMDIQMPIMNGYDASQAIRNGEAGAHNRDIPIIALTAHVSLVEQQKALQVGMNKHINKPIVPENLLKAIEECLSSSK